MSNNKIIKLDSAIPARFRDWFGAPAVLTAEDLRIHDRILCGLYHDVRPQDFIECIHIHDPAYNVSRRLTLRRRRDYVIRHAHNEKFERQERELLQDAERRKEEVRKDFGLKRALMDPRYPGVRDRQPKTNLRSNRK
jgi:hypothetical protein